MPVVQHHVPRDAAAIAIAAGHGALRPLCDDIVVLYQGSVTEAGSVEKVIRAPQHPYTQLLVSSIPLPDRSKRWGDDDAAGETVTKRATSGCRFAPRCDRAMAHCQRHRIDRRRT